MNNSKRGFILVVVLSVILVLVIVAGTIKEKHDNKVSNEEYEKYVQTANNEGSEENSNRVEEEQKEDPSKVKGLGNKLKAKQDVKVLILGDDIAMSIGKNSEGGIWSEGFKSLLQTTYGSKVDLKLVAKEGATTKTALASIKENDVSNYDLVVFCYGNNDAKELRKLQEVKDNYTEIIKKVKEKSPDALMISVLESSLELNNSYRLAVNEVSTSNSVIKADMREAFNSSGKKDSALSKNGFPNDVGYQIYTQTIWNKIKEAIG